MSKSFHFQDFHFNQNDYDEEPEHLMHDEIPGRIYDLENTEIKSRDLVDEIRSLLVEYGVYDEKNRFETQINDMFNNVVKPFIETEMPEKIFNAKHSKMHEIHANFMVFAYNNINKGIMLTFLDDLCDKYGVV